MDHTGTDDPGPEEEARQGEINMLQIWVLKQGDICITGDFAAASFNKSD